jgi:probable HAF family extracellular repeat protein
MTAENIDALAAAASRQTLPYMKPSIKPLVLVPALILILAAGVVDVAEAAVGGGGSQYMVIDLGTNAAPVSINYYRQIVGSSHNTPNTNQFGLSWNGILSSNIVSPATVLAAPVGATRYLAAHVNLFGEICGALQSPIPGYALFWSNNVSESMSLGSVSVLADDINVYGQTVGQLMTQSAPSQAHAAYWTNSQSTPVDLGTLGGTNSGAVSINSSGQIAGSSELPDGQVHAAFWPSNSGAPIDLGTLGGSNSAAQCINDSGAMVGYANTATQTGASYDAAYWTNAFSPALDLATLGGTNTVASGINYRGAIVGFCISNGIAHALYWTNATSSPVDLNNRIPTNSGWVLEKATAISDLGDVVGLGTFNGQDHGFLLAGENTSTYTSSTRNIETNLTSTVNQQATNCSTELVAMMPGGTVLFDQTFNAAFSDPAVQTAVTQAAGDLTGAGATSYTGPTPTSPLGSLSFVGSSSVTVTNSIGTSVSVTVTTYIGPQTIMVGPNQSISFYILPGGVHIDTLVTSVVTNLVTTTNTSTYLNSAVYMMTGIVAQPELGLAAVRSNQFAFTITGTSNLSIVVEACTNLASPSWAPLQICTLTNGPIYFSDPARRSYPMRFYRTRLP